MEWVNQFLDTTLAAYRITVVFLNLHRNHVLYTLFRGIVIGCMGLGCDYIYGEVEFIYLKSKWSQLWSTHIFIEFLAYDCLEILATKLLISSSNATLHIAKIPLIQRHFLTWNQCLAKRFNVSALAVRTWVRIPHRLRIFFLSIAVMFFLYHFLDRDISR